MFLSKYNVHVLRVFFKTGNLFLDTDAQFFSEYQKDNGYFHNKPMNP